MPGSVGLWIVGDSVGGQRRWTRLVLARETEIENLDALVRGDEDVFRLQIAMDDAFVVRGGETARDLHGVGDGAAMRQRSVSERVAKRRALEQLHHRVARPSAVPKS